MKILVIGDFHGEFPKFIPKFIKKEKVDLIISTGDYSPFSTKKLFFKYVYGKKDVELWEIIGKKKYRKMTSRDHKKGENVIKKLNSLPVPIITVLGNHDYSLPDDVTDIEKPPLLRFWKWDWDERTIVSKFIDKMQNIKKIDYNYLKFRGLVFVGARGHSFPGHVKSKAYKKSRKKLESIFIKFRKENKEGKLIFISHVPPYKTKIDLIHAKDAHKKVKGKHYGSKLFRRILKKYQPLLSISGHIEESKGKDKIGKTIILNAGSTHHEDYVLIDLDENKGKINNIKFFGKNKSHKH
ncbi:MAG: metallophosphoesterase family protein [Nanobdellota archaeon]